MPKIDGIGSNWRNTPKKQTALDGLAKHLLGSVAAIARKYRTDAVVLDMTCGRGWDNDGNPGSPLILAKHVAWLNEKGLSCTQVCVDREAGHLEKLEATMMTLYPHLSVRYETDQREALKGLSPRTVGLAYFDPTHYKDLDEGLLSEMGQRFERLDILFTHQGVAYARMKGAAHTSWVKGIEDYLAATGKRCRYVVEFATYGRWAFGFADNWDDRPAGRLSWPGGKLLNVNTSQGRAVCDMLMQKQKELQPCNQMTLF